jgi:23S rRNA (cytidine2498-2'-O)-methyltransferase
MMTKLSGKIYQPITDFEHHLEKELSAANPHTQCEKIGPFFYIDENKFDSMQNDQIFWTQNIWKEPIRIEFDSISEAARELKSIQRNWAPSLFTQFRRGALIQEKLPSISQKAKSFPWLLPESSMGSWTLLDANTIIASPLCSSPFPGGIINFEEDKINPPSRAYLKLQEALVRARTWPQPGEKCLDAGACPGGWTWVLANLGANIIAVDRSPLDERLMQNPAINFIKHDAFTLKPEDIGPVDWFFSDVICYPEKLYSWIEKWLASGLCKNFVCTIKMQGEADFETTKRFAEIPGSHIVHLCYNKHELTWMKID